MKRDALRKAIVTVFLTPLLFFPFVNTGWAQYPTKPITMVCGWGAGGATDISLRGISEAVSKILGQPVVVVNKAGGGSAVQLTFLKTQKPDGYTLGTMAGGGILGQHLHKANYDVTKDFTPIMLYGIFSHGVTVHSNAPWKTFKELVDYAKANPKKIKYTTPGAGSINHLAMEAFSQLEGVDWIHIPNNSDQEAISALLGGHVDVAVTSSGFVPFEKSGRVRLLATYNPQKLPGYPNVPTWPEIGYKFSVSSFLGVAGPKGLPKSIASQLYDAFKKAVDDPDFKKTMDSLDMRIICRNPEEMANDIEVTNELFKTMVQKLGLRKE